MTEQSTARVRTGTPWIVWGIICAVVGLFGLLRVVLLVAVDPSAAAGLITVVLLAAGATLLLLRGLRLRREYLANSSTRPSA